MLFVNILERGILTFFFAGFEHILKSPGNMDSHFCITGTWEWSQHGEEDWDIERVLEILDQTVPEA